MRHLDYDQLFVLLIWLDWFCILVEKEVIKSDYYFILFPMASLIFLIKLYRKKEQNLFQSIALFYLGIVYVVVPFALMNVIVFYHHEYGYEILLGLLLIIWASDSGAYFAGTYFGKNKLFERISPFRSSIAAMMKFWLKISSYICLN